MLRIALAAAIITLGLAACDTIRNGGGGIPLHSTPTQQQPYCSYQVAPNVYRFGLCKDQPRGIKWERNV